MVVPTLDTFLNLCKLNCLICSRRELTVQLASEDDSHVREFIVGWLALYVFKVTNENYFQITTHYKMRVTFLEEIFLGSLAKIEKLEDIANPMVSSFHQPSLLPSDWT